jgi:hypothetical protein
MDTSTILDMKNKISPEDMESLVRHQVHLIASEPSVAANLPPLMIWGGPGLGKSTILRKIAEELSIGFIDIRLAQREPVDIRGLPVPKEDSVSWLISSDWPRDPQSRGILLFDELTAADRSLQVAAYEIILDRRLGDLYHLPDGWYIVAAGNREEDMAVATSMSSALANRFMHVELQESSEEWVRWGLQNGIHPAVIGFIRFRPDLLFHQKNENLERGWPTPRSWERVSTTLHSFQITDKPYLLDKMIYGLVGNQAGVEFAAFRELASQFEDTYELMTNPRKIITIPEKPDQRYAFCAAVAYHLWRGKNAEEEEKLLSGFYRIAMALPSDFATMLMLDALTGNRKTDDPSVFADKLYNHHGYEPWANKHGKAMRARMNRKALQP